MTTYLIPVNERGERVDATGKVVARVVPVELPTHAADAIRDASDTYPYKPFPDGEKLGYMQVSIIHRTMLSAATLDIAALAVKVPGPDLRYHAEYIRGWNACLTALGVK